MEDWLKKTRAEREAVLAQAYGPSRFPGLDRGTRVPFPAELQKGLGIPEGVALAFAPSAAARRPHWTYATLGLSQPLKPEDLDPKAQDPEQPGPSRFGFEVAIQTKEPADWAPAALFALAWYLVKQPVRPGTRAHFSFARSSKPDAMGRDALQPVAGALGPNQEKTGEISSAVLWPPLDREAPFVTSTGRFDLLVATGITADELGLATETSSAHLLRLLVIAGVSQLMKPFRKSVLEDPKMREQWEGLKALTREQALDALYGPA